MQMMPVIAHISDLHFSGGNHNSQAREQLRRSIVNSYYPPDFVVVTGDVTQWGCPSQMREAHHFLESLLGDIWKDRQKIARCIVVRGNHDAFPSNFLLTAWIKRRKAWTKIFGNGSFISKEIEQTQCSRLAADVTPATIQGFTFTHWEYFPTFQLAFLKIDSNVGSHLRIGRIASGAIGAQQFADINVELQKLDASFPGAQGQPGFCDSRRVVLIHHHVLHLPNSQHEAEMLLDDSGDLRDRLSRFGIDMILHGHRHRANQAGLIHWEDDRQENRTIVLAAGSACARDTDDGSNSYHLIRFGSCRVDAWRPQFVDGAFTSISSSPRFEFQLPFLASPNFERIGERPLMLDALVFSLREAENSGDSRHGYRHISCTGFIDDKLNYWGRYILSGRNISGSASRFISFHLTAVGAQEPESFNLQARDLVLDAPLPEGELEEDKRLPTYLFRIPFLEPLQPNGEFRIQITFCLPRVMLSKSDYDLLNLARFPGGIGAFEHTLVSTRQIVMPTYLAVFRRRIVDASLPIAPVKSVDVSWVDPSLGVTTADGFTVKSDKPVSQCYLFYYDRLAPKPGATQAINDP